MTCQKQSGSILKCAEALANRGLAFLKREWYERELRILMSRFASRGSPPNHFNCAPRSISAQQFSKGVADVDEAIWLGFDLVQNYRLRAAIRSKTGDDAGRLADLTAIITIEPKDAASYLDRARCFAGQRQYDSESPTWTRQSRSTRILRMHLNFAAH